MRQAEPNGYCIETSPVPVEKDDDSVEYEGEHDHEKDGSSEDGADHGSSKILMCPKKMHFFSLVTMESYSRSLKRSRMVLLR